MARNWSTKTLAKQLVEYIRAHSEIHDSTAVADLLAAISGSIVEEEVGISLDPWSDDED